MFNHRKNFNKLTQNLTHLKIPSQKIQILVYIV